MDELDALKAVSERLEKLSPDERGRVLAWLNAKYLGAQNPVPASTVVPTASPPAASSKKAATTSKLSKKKAKSIIAMDKSLNLSPSGKKSAAQFAAEKDPSNVKQKCVVAVYYLRDILALEKVSVSGVYTVFKSLGWVVPADLKNTLQQAGTEGWLDTADAEDIKITSMGENLIEHSLAPKKP
jgi:hypothetical protein